MADASSDPVAAAQMESLVRALGQLTGRLQATGAEIDTSAAKAQTAAVDLEAAVRQELEAGAKLGAGGGGAGAGATTQATSATNALAAAEQRANAAVAERLALEQREAALVAEIAAEQAKAGGFRTNLAGAQIGAMQSAGAYGKTVRSAAAGNATQQDAEIALQQKQADQERLNIARQEMGASAKTLSGLQSQLTQTEGQLNAARELEAQTGKEVAEETQRVALGQQLNAALAARLRQLEGTVGGGGAGGGGRPPVIPGGTGGGGGYGGMPPPSQAILAEQAAATRAAQVPVISPVNLRTDPLTADEAATKKAAAASRELSTAKVGAGTSAANEARFMQQSSQALEKNNALHTDYLKALAAGTTTTRDFGSQMGQTIAKFGGWTLAAGLVYGVIGGVTELGKGALATVSSVQNLQRTIDQLDTSRASAQIRNLAQDTVTPINEAGDAVFQFSRTFHNQDDAVYAAGLALRAYKLDGVDLGLQVRAQTAIFRQFHTSMSEMGAEYGLLANGQRLFNARVTEMIPALLGSSSVISSVGGNLSEFTKILQYMLVTTQLSGTRLATAFSRAPGFINRPKSRNALESLGLDPDQALTDFDTFFEKALQKSKNWSGEQKRLFLGSTFGTKIGPRAAGSFAAAPTQLFDQIFGQNIKSAGPLMEEFSKYFDVPQHKISELGVRLQALGSNLADSGLLNGVGVLITALDEALKVSNSLLNIFNQIPGPLKTAVALLAMLKVTGLVAGRFQPTEGGKGFGQAFAQFGMAMNPGKAEKAMALGALDSENALYKDIAESSAQRAGRLQVQVASAKEQLATMEATGATDKEITAQTGRIATLKAQAEEQMVLMERAQADQNTIDRQRVTYQNALNRRMSQAAAQQEAGFSVIPSRVKGEPAMLGPVAPGGGAAAANADAAAAGAAAGASREQTGAQLRLFEANNAEAAALEANAAQQGELGASSRRVSRAATLAGSATMAGTATLTAGRAALSTLGGLLNPWIIALVGLPLVIGKVSDAMKKLDSAAKQSRDALTAPPSGDNIKALAESAGKEASAQRSLWVPIGQRWHEFKNTVSDMFKKLDDAFGDSGPKIPTAPKPGQSQAAYWAERLRDAAKPTVTLPLPIPGVPPIPILPVYDAGAKKQIAQDALAAMDARVQSLYSYGQSLATADLKTAEGRKKLQQLITTMEGQGASDPAMKALKAVDPARYAKAIEDMRAKLQSLLTPPQDLRQLGAAYPAMPGVGTADLTTNVDALKALSDKTKVYGTSTEELRHMTQLFTFIAASQAGSNDPKVLQQVDTARTEMVDAIKTHMQTLIDAANAIVVPSVKVAGLAAHNAALRQRTSLLNQASAIGRQVLAQVGQAVTSFDASIGATDANLALAQETLDLINSAIAAGEKNMINSMTKLPAFAGGKATPSGQSLSSLKAAVANWLANTNTQANAATQAAQMANTGIQPLLNSIGNKNQSAANNIAAANAAANKSTAGTDPFGIARLQTELTKAQNAQDPVAQARADIAFAGKELAAAKDEKERLQAQIDMTNAQNALSTALKDVRDARYKYLESLTTNPLKIDQLEVKSATADMAKVPKGTKAWYDAAAARNNALTKYRDDRVQERDDTIQFQLQMGDISQQQAESDIAAMLRIKNLSYATRKRLKRELEQLQKGTKDEFSDLNLDSIKLPTPYEVRRATMAAAQAGMNVTQTYNSTINVNDPASAASVGVQMDRFHQGTSKAMSRARAGR